MKTKSFAILVIFWLFVLAAPSAFAAPGVPSFSSKANVQLPLKKGTRSIVCVNRNFYDTQKFGDALCAALEKYSVDCRVKLAEFIQKEDVAPYDYVWSFQVTAWSDKNSDDEPEKVRALVLLYDKDFNVLARSKVQIKKSKDPAAPNCLKLLLDEYLDSLFNAVIEEKPSSKSNEE